LFSLLFHPDYVITPVLAWGLFMVILLLACAISLSGTNFLERFNRVGLVWLILVTVILIVVPLVSAPRIPPGLSAAPEADVFPCFRPRPRSSTTSGKWLTSFKPVP
jgi:amino acid transporter